MPDLIVIGSGLGGLCAAAIASRHGLEVQVLEAHSQPGGAAHGFRRGPFHFESGPSLWSGLGRWPSANPLAQVLRAVGESVPVVRYSEWGLLLPEGNLRVGVGLDPFLELLRSMRGPGVAAEWQDFLVAMAPLCRAAGSLPLLALRPGAGLLTTLGSQGLGLIGQAGQLAALGGAFGPIARRHLRDPFLLHWVEMLCFLISGLEPDQTSAAAMATLFGEWFEPDAGLDYPLGGSPAVVDALVRGIRRHGGELRTGAAVAEIELSGGRATGVRLVSGERLNARHGVISNASPWDTAALLGKGSAPERWRQKLLAAPACPSFLHWHLAFKAEGLAELPIHHVWVGDWQRGIRAERNMVVLSMPSRLDPSLAPPGTRCCTATLQPTNPGSSGRIWSGALPPMSSCAASVAVCSMAFSINWCPIGANGWCLSCREPPSAIAIFCGCTRAAMDLPGRPTAEPSPAAAPRSKAWCSAVRAYSPELACRL